MMDEMRELYQATILDHNKSPRNFSELPNGNRTAHGDNPLCGDKLTVFIELDGDRVADVAFKGVGCAISTASASLMTESLKGKTLEEAKALFQRFHSLLTGRATVQSDDAGLGKLEVFSGVCKYPARVKCATLVWHTVNAALQNKHEVVTTE